MKNLNKKAVSGVIVTVLLVLLVFAAVAIVWAVISSFLSEQGGIIAQGLDTVSLDIIDNSLKYNSTDGLEVKVKRNIGKGNITGINLVVNGETTGQFKYSKVTGGEIVEGETVKIRFEEGLPENITSIAISPITIANGREVIGNVKDEAVPGRGFVGGEVLYLSGDTTGGFICGAGGCPDIKPNGKYGNAFYFSGSQNAEFNVTSSDWADNSLISFVAWVKTEDLITARRIIDGSADNKKGMSIYILDSQLYYRMSTDSNSQTFSFTDTNNYHFVAMTTSTAGTYYYLDDMAPKTDTRPYEQSDNHVIGGNVGNTQNWKGYIDEVRIYQRALTAQEIYYLRTYG